MGYELNQLMKRYGVSTPTMSSYGGMGAPTALAADATAAQKEQFVTDSGNYMAQKAAYDQYKNDYQNRIASTSAYQDSPLFKGEKKSWDTALKTPNYSLATPKTDADYAPLINKAYADIGRTGIGDKVSNIDQGGYDSMMFKLKTGEVSPDDFNAYFTKAANDYMNKNPDTDLTKYVKGYQNPTENNTALKDLAQMPLVAPAAAVASTPAATPATTPTVAPTVEETSTPTTDPYSYADNFGSWYDSYDPGWARGGPVRHFYGGGYNDVGGGINDLVDKYELANPAELPVMMAKNDTGTMTDAVPSVPVSDTKLRDMQNSAVRAGEPPMQRGPVPEAESAPQMTTPTPAGGATLGAAPAAPAATGTPSLQTLYERYTAKQPKSAEMTAAEQKYASKNDALINLLKEQANKTEDNAPSKAEMYFRLAAALASPSKTGYWSENIGLAAKELADFQKSTTDAKKAAAAAKLQLLLKTGEIDAQQAKEELANLKEGEKEGRDVARTFAMKEYETEAKKGEPQSEFGKVLKESGVQPGTPAYKEAMTDRARLETAQKGIALQAARRAEDEKTNMLTPKEADKAFELEKEVRIQEAALADLKKARGLSDKAYLPTWWDTAEKAVQSQIDENDPTVQATETLNRILNGATLQSAAKMKGSLSNKDLTFLEEMSGKSFKNRQSRNESIDDAMKKLEAEIAASQNDLKRVRAGEFRNKLSGESK